MSTICHRWHRSTASFKWSLQIKNYLEVTDYQDSQSNANVVISKHGHLCFNVHPVGTNTASNGGPPLPQSRQWRLTRIQPCRSQPWHRRSRYSSGWCCRCTSCWAVAALGAHARTPRTCWSSCCTRATWEARRHRGRGRTGPPPPSLPCPSRWQNGTVAKESVRQLGGSAPVLIQVIQILYNEQRIHQLKVSNTGHLAFFLCFSVTHLKCFKRRVCFSNFKLE